MMVRLLYKEIFQTWDNTDCLYIKMDDMRVP